MRKREDTSNRFSEYLDPSFGSRILTHAKMSEKMKSVASKCLFFNYFLPNFRRGKILRKNNSKTGHTIQK